MGKLVVSFFFFFLLLLLCLIKVEGGGPSFNGGRTLFVFGDSLFDPGNNQYINKSSSSSKNTPSSYWPYGETFFKHPTGRISDGRIVPDFIAKFARLPMLPPYLQPGVHHHLSDGANFASAGASAVTRISSPPLMKKMTTMPKIDLLEQLSYFKDMVKSMHQQLGTNNTKEVLGRAVYVFSIGGNDYFSTATTMPNHTHQSLRIPYVATVIGNITDVIREIYEMGGRKIGFQNVGPLGCTPGQKATNPNATNWCNDNLSAFARLHNRQLTKALKKLASQLPGFKYSIFDYYNALTYIIFNPFKAGFKEGQSACCGIGPFRGSGCGPTAQVCSNPSEYVWFDGAHTTERANYHLAQLIWTPTPTPTPTPPSYTFRQLFTL